MYLVDTLKESNKFVCIIYALLAFYANKLPICTKAKLLLHATSGVGGAVLCETDKLHKHTHTHTQTHKPRNAFIIF